MDSPGSAAVRPPKVNRMIWAEGAQGRTFNEDFKVIQSITLQIRSSGSLQNLQSGENLLESAVGEWQAE